MNDEAADATRGAADGARFRYDARLANEIELRWQRRWAEEGTYHSPNPSGLLSEGYERFAGQPKFYMLDMFPYPSGSGLHVGHPLGYIGSDVFARYLRMAGYHVVHPFGYDAFGLPAEQCAIDNNQHPRVTTENNIANMRRQLRRLGLGHDERREVATTDVAYYRWTQWIFLQLFESWVDERTGTARPITDLASEYESGTRPTPDGRRWDDMDEVEQRRLLDERRLAFISHQPVNWCPGLGTVLANEEVTAEGRSDVGNYPVFRRAMRQWMLRITAMADRLVRDLDLVDWPEPIKLMQRNWIGASDGARIDLAAAHDVTLTVEIFTTRPDTLYGATFVLLAPEHPLVARLTRQAWPEGTPERWRYPDGNGGDASWSPPAAVAAYEERAARMSDRQRQESCDKTCVFTGSNVVNPVTSESIPVFVADYVLMGHGTGAIMAVPAHDQRDLDFARAFGLAVREVLQPPTPWLAQHGLPADTPPTEWPEAFTGDGTYVATNGPDLTGLAKAHAVSRTIAWLTERGIGRAERSYRLRDWLFSRQRYWGEPFPIVFDEHDLPHAVPDDLLPVELPEMSDFRPSSTGTGESSEPIPPLAKIPHWVRVYLDLGDGLRRYRRETNTMPQWAGSCWYYLRYLDPTNPERFVDADVERYWMVPPHAEAEGEGGVDLYIGGVEHAVLHLLYTRFWHKVLYDLGHVSTAEPFRRLYNQGYILADAFVDQRGMYVPAADVVQHDDGTCTYQGQPVARRAGKMGKSLKNSVSPDEMYERYGADTLRLYEMAMGPLDVHRPWQTNDVIGVHRFLQRLWRSLIDEDTGELRVVDRPLDAETERHVHQTIKAVRAEFAELRFNTAIARLMELTNRVVRISRQDGTVPRALAETLVLLLAPLAPHVASELWERQGHQDSIVYAPFPEHDDALTAEHTVTMPVQINNKVRFTIDVPASAGEDDIRALLRTSVDFEEHAAGATIRRLIVVPGRIVNVVVG